jgi:hypothetical protein
MASAFDDRSRLELAAATVAAWTITPLALVWVVGHSIA